jgi:hypothetical protein
MTVKMGPTQPRTRPGPLKRTSLLVPRARSDVPCSKQEGASAQQPKAPDVEQYLQVTESVCIRGDAPEKTVSTLDAMLREV